MTRIRNEWNAFLASTPGRHLGRVLRTMWQAVLRVLGWLLVILSAILVPLAILATLFFAIAIAVILVGDQIADGVEWIWDESEADQAWSELMIFLDIEEEPAKPLSPAESIEATAEAERADAEATIAAIEATTEAQEAERNARATEQAEAMEAAVNATATAKAQQSELATAQALATEQAAELATQQAEAEAEATRAAMPTEAPDPTIESPATADVDVID